MRAATDGGKVRVGVEDPPPVTAASSRPKTAAADRPKTAAADRPKTAAGQHVSPHPRSTSHMGEPSRPQTTASPTRLPSTSPFHDMDLDEIISPEMRLAVRRTLAMNQMLAEHEAAMKRYNTARRKQLAIASILRSKGVEPCSASGTQVTADQLLASSPRTLQALGLSRSTTQQVVQLIAEQLATDGSSATESFTSPTGNHPPVLHLPLHLFERRGVQFRNASPTPDQLQGILGKTQQAAGNALSLQQVLSDKASARAMGGTDGSGLQQYASGTDQAESVFYSVWGDDPDIPMAAASTARSSPRPAAAVELKLPADEAQLLQYLEQQWAAQKVHQVVHPFKAPPVASLPEPEEGALPSDRSLTTSIVLRVVDQGPPAEPQYINRLQLKAQVRSRDAVYPPPDAVELRRLQAAWDAKAGHSSCWQDHDGDQGRTAATAAGQADVTANPAVSIGLPPARTAGGQVPLAIQVFGCMAAKANGLDYVAQPRRSCNSPERNSSALPTCSSCPTLHMLDRHQTYLPSHQPQARTLELPPVNGGSAITRQKTASSGGLQPSSPNSASAGKRRGTTVPYHTSGLEALGSKVVEAVQQHRGRQHADNCSNKVSPHTHARTETGWPAPKLPLSSNLSLSFVRGDRVPRPGSKQALPCDAVLNLNCSNANSPIDSAVAAYAHASLQRHALHSAPVDRSCCMHDWLHSQLSTWDGRTGRNFLQGRNAASLGGSMEVFNHHSVSEVMQSGKQPACNQLTAAAAALKLPRTFA